MARALGAGIADSGQVTEFIVFDPVPAAVEAFRETLNASAPINVVRDNAGVFETADAVFLAVKPQMFDDVAKSIRGDGGEAPVVISIMAGVSLDQIIGGLGHSRIIRTMPNTPCLVGKGAIAMAAAESVSKSDRELAAGLLGTTGIVVEVKELLLDAVTGLSGSGPAYVFEFIDSLAESAVGLGLDVAVANQLAIQTVLGAATLAMQSDVDLMELKQRVMSPGGTTVAGVGALDQHNFRKVVGSAVVAATKRSIELGLQK